MLLSNLISPSSTEAPPRSDTTRQPTLGHLVHPPEGDESLVKKLNRLRQERNAPPPASPDPFWTNIAAEQTRQDEMDRQEMLVRVKARRLSAADAKARQQLDEAERQLTEGY